jgi:hypothetical protein
MTILRRLTVALLAFALLAAGADRAASTTNFSDQWWVPSESGWGASVLQQADVLFVDLFVYGSDGKPTWFTAAATLQSGSPAGHAVFTGDLYLTAGSYFGGAWNPAAMAYRKVGTLTFDAATINDATLTYAVDGTAVVKGVTRQLWRYENLTGRYYGGNSGEQTQCGADNGRFDEKNYIEITHNPDNSIAARFTTLEGDWLAFAGTYTQFGHMGQIAGTGTTSEGLTFTFNLFEIERTISGITGRGHIVIGSGCTWDGRWGGVRR